LSFVGEQFEFVDPMLPEFAKLQGPLLLAGPVLVAGKGGGHGTGLSTNTISGLIGCRNIQAANDKVIRSPTTAIPMANANRLLEDLCSCSVDVEGRMNSQIAMTA
jgi:hypothetical protein